VQPVTPAPVLAPAEAAAPRKPSVAEVLATTSGPAGPTTSAKDGLGDNIAAAKTSKRRKSTDAVSAKSVHEGEAAAKPAPKSRAKKLKPEAGTPSS
jgi:hypothetical protein